MITSRTRFESSLSALSAQVFTVSDAVLRELAGAAQALHGRDLEACDAVIRAGDAVGRLRLSVVGRAIELLALQAPVAYDLSFVVAQFHISYHFGRIGDSAVNIAKLVQLTDSLPANPAVEQRLVATADEAIAMFDAAVGALRRRDASGERFLAEWREVIERRHQQVVRDVLHAPPGADGLTWGMHMSMASGQYLRVADHLVHVGGQVAGLVGTTPAWTRRAPISPHSLPLGA